MPPKSTQIKSLADAFPKHPHRTIHILFSILAFVIVVGSVVVYQTRFAREVVESPPTPVVKEDPRVSQLTAINNKKGGRIVSQADVIDGLKAVNARKAELAKQNKKK